MLATAPSTFEFIQPSHPNFPFSSLASMTLDIYLKGCEWDPEYGIPNLEDIIETSAYEFVEVGIHQFKDDPNTCMYDHYQDYISHQEYLRSIFEETTDFMDYLLENNDDFFDLSYRTRAYVAERRNWASDIRTLLMMHQYCFMDDDKVVNPPMKGVW